MSVLVVATPRNPPLPDALARLRKPTAASSWVVVVTTPPPMPGAGGAPGMPGTSASPGRGKRHLPSFVSGSLYSLRRNFCFTSTSSEAGSALPFLRW